jgi:hypothetical protein
VGTLARKQAGDLNLNESTVFYNPELFDALERTRRGEDVELFDKMFAGLNLANGVSGYGPVGTVVNGVLQRGSAHLRRSTAAVGASTVGGTLANGNFEGVANALLNLAPTGLQTGPTGVTGIQQRTVRNGCDRLGNGIQFVQQTAPGVSTAGFNASNATPLRCFPENYLVANPQFTNATDTANIGHTNYHALQVQSTVRPSNGVSLQATYSWAKSMELLSSNGFGDPLQRDRDYQRGRQGPHSFRMNGTVELPIGPNKLLFGNASGLFARLIEQWQTSFILWRPDLPPMCLARELCAMVRLE